MSMLDSATCYVVTGRQSDILVKFFGFASLAAAFLFSILITSTIMLCPLIKASWTGNITNLKLACYLVPS